MKKLFTLIFLLTSLGFIGAQTFMSKQWNVQITSDDGGHPSVFRRYFFGNDSMVVEDNVYWPLIESPNETGNSGITYGYFRESGNIIYKYITENDDEYKFYNVPIGEVLYYNFGLVEGDTIKSYIWGNDIVVTQVDSFELMDGSNRKSISLECIDGGWLSNATWVDGIGDLTRGFEGVRLLCDAPEGDWTLQCLYENSSIVYMNPDAEECFLVSTSEIPKKEIIVFPNPAGDLLKVEGLTREISFKIFNQIGKKIKDEKTNNSSIGVENLPKGLYFLTFQLGDIFISKAFTKI